MASMPAYRPRYVVKSNVPTTVDEIMGNRPSSGGLTRYVRPKGMKVVPEKEATTHEIKPSLELPAIYQTGMIDKLRTFIRSSDKIAFLQAPTGLGKTVGAGRELAKHVKENGGIFAIIVMPFRVSVTAMYDYQNRLNEAFGEDLKFGYMMGRGYKKISDDDHVRFMTVGFFKEWSSYWKVNSTERQIIMVDEAHDPSWQTSYVLEKLGYYVRKGAPFKIIISSATLNTSGYSRLFANEPVIISHSTKLANISWHYTSSLKPDRYTPKDVLDGIKKAIGLDLSGGILVILPGLHEIEEMDKLISKEVRGKFDVRFLHSSMTKEELDDALKPKETDQVIYLATNIVENAITIDGLDIVVDCCFRKENVIDRDGIEELRTVPATKSNVIQAAGRVGRQGRRGHAFICLTETAYTSLEDFPKPEHMRNPRYREYLHLKMEGLEPTETMIFNSHGEITLWKMKLVEFRAIDGLSGNITEIGKQMAKLNLSLRSGAFLASCINTKMDPSMLWWASALAARLDNISSPMFFKPSKKSKYSADEVAELQQLYRIKDADWVMQFFHLWHCAHTEPYEHENPKRFGYRNLLYYWCNKISGMFVQTVVDLQFVHRRLMEHLEIDEPKFDDDIDLKQIRDCLIPHLKVAYGDRIFTCSTTYGPPKYNERSLESHIEASDRPDTLIAFQIRRIVPHNGKRPFEVITAYCTVLSEKN